MSTTDSSYDYLSVAETAKLVRKALKQRFPGTKFSVRSSSYAGGASIDVGWTDGPLADDVKEIVSLYEGSHGEMSGGDTIKMPHDSLIANEDGTVRSVHFGEDYIFANRHVSEARERLYRRELERFIGEKVDGSRYQPVKVSVCGKYQTEYTGKLSHDDHSTDDARNIVRQMGLIRPWHGEPCAGGDGNYCPSCRRYQGDHRAPHLW